MKKALEKIKTKPAEIRMTIAIALALLCTGIIAAGWGMTFSSTTQPKREKAPSPISAFAGAVKDVINPSQNSQKIQIINAGDVLYDESNPYQTTEASPAAESTTQ